MHYLLDTHVLLWWLAQPEKITQVAFEIIKNKSNSVYVSSASFWEMGIKKGLGRLTLPQNLLESVITERFKILPIMPEDGLGVADLPHIHADPFDRILIIQAKRHDLTFITHDSQIAAYPVLTIKA